MLKIPVSLGGIGSSSQGRAWLERLPRVIGECAERWSLSLGEPFPNATASLTVPATLPDRTSAVLKIQFPHREAEREADALTLWDGDGAVRLFGHDAEHHALLVERCEPGTSLSELPQDEALEVMIDLLPRLWKPAGLPFRSLTEEAAWWAEHLPGLWEKAGRPFERKLLDAALEALHALPASQGGQVLVHQDLHADNVLRARREPWLVIDPKPLAGEREFGIAALIRGDELGRGPHHLRHRLLRLNTDLSLDLERARGWALGQTLAWAFEGSHVFPDHVEAAAWLLETKIPGG